MSVAGDQHEEFEVTRKAVQPIPNITIGGLPIARLTMGELVQVMMEDCLAARRLDLTYPRVVTSANGSVVAAYHSNPDFRACIDAADIVDADGMPLVHASRLFCKQPLAERTATTDFLLEAASAAATTGLRFYFLGARPGVAARAAEHLRSRFPGLQIAGTRNGYFAPDELPEICAGILARKADVLWLGLGSPLQERIALAIRDLLPGLGWIRTCGGLFDHYGGGVSRAPEWMQNWGLEWLYRSAREPLRLGWRYLVTSPIAAYYLLTKTRG